MQEYVVKCAVNLIDLYHIHLYGYIKKVISYKKNKCKYTIDNENDHKYKSEKAALKAAQAFNGRAELI